MKKRIPKRILSVLLTILMVMSMVPLGAIPVSAIPIDVEGEPSLYIGMGYNALEGENIDIFSLKADNWLNHDEAGVYVLGDGEKVLSQKSGSFYAESATELLQNYGLDYSASAEVSLSNKLLKKASIGLESKFDFGFNLSTAQMYEELYYSYYYEAIVNRYTVKSDYKDHLSQDFLDAVDALAKNPTDINIESFFETYGTHMLSSFFMGGRLELTAWAIAQESSLSIDAKTKQEVSANGSYTSSFGNTASANIASSIALNLGYGSKVNGLNAGSKLYALGGDPVFIDTTNTDTTSDTSSDSDTDEETKDASSNTTIYDYASRSFTLDKENLEKWVNSVKGQGVFIPESTEWVAIWDVLPQEEKYSTIRTLLYQYFIEHAQVIDNEFMAKYCNYNSWIELNNMTYVSPNGYVFTDVELITSGSPSDSSTNYIAPGSRIILNGNIQVDFLSEDSAFSYELDSRGVNLLQNGEILLEDNVLTISPDAYVEKSFDLLLKVNETIISYIPFYIAEESTASGGYGTQDRPYLISTATDITGALTSLAETESCYLLTNDINMEGNSFEGIAKFNGVLDGNGYCIYNFTLSTIKDWSAGFIRYNTGTIKNLTIGKKDFQMSDFDYSVNINVSETKQHSSYTCLKVGALVGENNGTIQNCSIENVYVYACLKDSSKDSDAADCNVGGLVGKHSKGDISNCQVNNSYINAYMPTNENTANTNQSYVGGIIGKNCANATKLISFLNEIYATAMGDGYYIYISFTKVYAYPYACAGGVVGYGATGDLSSSIAFDNTVNATATAPDGNTVAKELEGGIVGQLTTSATSTLSNYCVGEYDAVAGNNSLTGYSKEDSLEKLAEHATWAIVTKDDNGDVTSIDIPSITSLTVTNDIPEQVVNTPLDLSGISVTAISNDRTTEELPIFHINADTYDPTVEGEKTLTVTGYGGLTATLTVTTTPKTLTGIDIVSKPYKTAYFAGESINVDGLTFIGKYNDGTETTFKVSDSSGSSATLTAIYEDGTEEELIWANVAITGFDSSTKGSKEVTVTYGGTVSFGPPSVGKVEEGEMIAPQSATSANAATVTTMLATEDDSAAEIMTVASIVSSMTGGFSDTFTVDVYAIEPAKLEVSTLPDKTSYAVGDSLDATGLTLKLTNNNLTNTTLTPDDVTLTGFDNTAEGSYEITATYSFTDSDGNADTLTATFTVSVGTVSKVEIATEPARKTYYIGYEGCDFDIDKTGLALKVTYSNGVTKTVTDTSAMTFQYRNASGLIDTMEAFDTVGQAHIRVTYEGAYDEYDIMITTRSVESIAVTALPRTQYYTNGINQFTTSGLRVQANYNNGTTGSVEDYTVQVAGYQIGETPTFTSTGTKTVTVTYEDVSTTYDVTISTNVVERIDVTQPPNKTRYKQGETFNRAGMVISAVLTDGSVQAISYIDEIENSGDLYYYYDATTPFTEVGETEFIIRDTNNHMISVNLTVEAPTRIAVTQLPDTTTYEQGETLDLSGLAVSATYYDGTSVTLSASDYTVDVSKLSEIGDIPVTVTYGKLTTTFYVTVTEVDLTNKPKVVVESKTAVVGTTQTIAVNISLENNPGIANMKLKVNYDSSIFTLSSVEDTGLLSGQLHSDNLKSPYTLTWANDLIRENITVNGAIVTLIFDVADNVEVGEYAITVSYDYDDYDIFDVDMQPVYFATVDGTITFIDVTFGDINSDEKVNTLDRTVLSRYLADWTDYPESCVNMAAADVNNDGKVNTLDRTILARHLADWVGYEVLPYAN